MSDDTINDLLKLLRVDAELIGAKFRRASTEGKGTPQEVADFREPVVQNFVRKFFPFPYRVTKGVIRDSYGGVSASVDCVLCNPIHPYTVEDDPAKFHLILADGVDAAIEVKPDISRTKLLEEGLEQSVSVRRLRRVRAPGLVIRHQVDDVDQLGRHARQIASFIYTMKCKESWLETLLETVDYYTRKGVDRLDQVDAIVIHGLGIMRNFKVPSEYAWGDGADAGKMGWVFENWGPDTLAGFLLHLNRVFASAMPGVPPVVSHYLDAVSVGIDEIEQQFAELLPAWRLARRQSRAARRRAKPPKPGKGLLTERPRGRGKPRHK